MDAPKVGLGSPRRLRRALVLVGVLCAVALPWSASAQVPTPLGELPVPTTMPPLLDDGVPDHGAGPPPVTTPTTAPPVGPSGTEGPRAVMESEEITPSPSSAPSRARRPSIRRPTRTGTPASAPAGEATLVQPAAVEVPDRPPLARLRRVTVPAAREFGFPLVLGVFVLAFLVVQGRLDARDPKLAAAPVTVDDDLLPFL